MKEMDRYGRLKYYIRISFNRIRFLINYLLEGLTVEAFFGLFILKVLLAIIIFNSLDIYTLVIFVFLSGIDCYILFSYCRYSLNKIINDWNGKDYKLLVANFITLAISLILLNGVSRLNSKVINHNFESISYLYSYLVLAYIIFVTLNLVIKNRIIIFITIATILYGLIDDQNFKILLGILVFALGAVNKDDIKSILGIEKFAEDKFVEDKFKIILAIVCSMFVNEYGEIFINWVSKIVDLNLDDNIFKYILNMGAFKLFTSILLFAIFLKIYMSNKENLKIRYLRKENSITTDSLDYGENYHYNSECYNCIDEGNESNL
ncbi:hypothetical protein NH288_02280 [Anaerococcus sp. NML200537]|uniref:hypothetical protein n=1 Tax=Anaerococcus sp. NML200537 TaxID=2954485 RepID=UPI002238DEF0|nr:hypothetical protein [Anaerococcus sp. NML200537]MCW6700918.1 hypothetical protein [Anaerococcus sp. NML200537]